MISPCQPAVSLYFSLFRVGLQGEEKSEVHKLSFSPAAYLPLLHRLSLSKLLCTREAAESQHNPDI
jgi:hypothetical protein